MPTRVVVQHRWRSLRDAVAGCVVADATMQLAGVACDATDLVAICEREPVDVAVIEADPSDWDALALVEELHAIRPALGVLAVCRDDCPCGPASERWAGRGTRIPAGHGPEAVLDAIRVVARQRAILSDRELEVLRLIGAGHTSAEISALLGISPRTVENHKRRIFAKLRVQSQAHAVANATRLGLLASCSVGPKRPRPPAARPAVLPLVLGSPSGVRDLVVEALRRCSPPRHEGPPAAGAVTVLVDPDADHWQAALKRQTRIVVVLSGEVDRAAVVEALLRGADAVLAAAQAPGQLVDTVERVAAGNTLVDPTLVRSLLDTVRLRLAAQPALAIDLTSREREILASIDRGDSVRQTAKALGISTRTVENLQHRMFRKLGVRNRAQAVAAAHARRLLASS